MGFFSNLFGKKKHAAPALEPEANHLAFILLREPRMPSFEDIAGAISSYSEGSVKATQAPSEDSGEDDDGTVMMIELGEMGTAFIALMPMAIPEQEAECYFEYSLSSFAEGAQLEPHHAHLVVSMNNANPSDAVPNMMAFISLLAAVIKSSHAAGIYWGNAGVSHTADFFLSIAQDNNITSRVPLWSGISRAAEPNGNVSLLSLGMQQLGLPNILLSSSPENASEAFEWIFDLIGYIAQRGEPLPNGDTIGTTESERLEVSYEPSPTGDGSIVMAIRK